MVRYGDGGPDTYCGCESCFNYWLQTFADGRPDGFDLYWDEPPRPERPADLRNLITFQGADAWRWDALRQGYVMLIRHGRVTMDGREWLALRPAYCT